MGSTSISDLTPTMRKALLWAVEQVWMSEEYMHVPKNAHGRTLLALWRRDLITGTYTCLLTDEGRDLAYALWETRPCETCNDDAHVCANVPGLRHCEKSNREDLRRDRPGELSTETNTSQTGEADNAALVGQEDGTNG